MPQLESQEEIARAKAAESAQARVRELEVQLAAIRNEERVKVLGEVREALTAEAKGLDESAERCRHVLLADGVRREAKTFRASVAAALATLDQEGPEPDHFTRCGGEPGAPTFYGRESEGELAGPDGYCRGCPDCCLDKEEEAPVAEPRIPSESMAAPIGGQLAREAPARIRREAAERHRVEDEAPLNAPLHALESIERLSADGLREAKEKKLTFDAQTYHRGRYQGREETFRRVLDLIPADCTQQVVEEGEAQLAPKTKPALVVGELSNVLIGLDPEAPLDPPVAVSLDWSPPRTTIRLTPDPAPQGVSGDGEEAGLSELLTTLQQKAAIHERRRHESKAAEVTDRESGKIGPNDSYIATWNYYEGVWRGYEWSARKLARYIAATQNQSTDTVPSGGADDDDGGPFVEYLDEEVLDMDQAASRLNALTAEVEKLKAERDSRLTKAHVRAKLLGMFDGEQDLYQRAANANDHAGVVSHGAASNALKQAFEAFGDDQPSKGGDDRG